MKIHRFLAALHHGVGVFALLFVLIIALSGVGINHANSWGLDRATISNKTIRAFYGFDLPKDLRSFSSANRWFVLIDNQLYVDGQATALQMSQLVAVTANRDFVFASSRSEIWILDRNNQLIDRMPGPQAQDNNHISGLGVDSLDRILLRTSGAQFWMASPYIDWQEDSQGQSVVWAKSDLISKVRLEILSQNYAPPELTVERILLDLHAGRWVGISGPILTDLLAAALIYLSLSGTWLWIRRRRTTR